MKRGKSLTIEWPGNNSWSKEKGEIPGPTKRSRERKPIKIEPNNNKRNKIKKVAKQIFPIR